MSHIHYGAIDPLDAGGLPEGMASGNIQISGFSDIIEEETAAMRVARERHDEAVRAIEAKTNARAMAIPTNDVAVKQKLRDFGEAACLFGEGPYERRERLRQVMLGRGSAPPVEQKKAEAEGEEDLFYTEGEEGLRDVRVKIAEYSVPKAHRRLMAERQERDEEDPLELEEKHNRYCHSLQKNMHTEVSQVGDERPLTHGKFNSDAKLFCTSGWSGYVKLWKVPSCDPVMTWRAHEDRCNAIAFHPHCKGVPPFEDKVDAVKLATACADAKIHLWNLSDTNPCGTLEGHEDRVNRIAFHPMGDFLVSTSHDCMWKLWDVNTNQEVLNQEGHAKPTYGIAFHHDGSLLATTDLGGLVRVWDLRSGKCILPLIGHGKQSLAVDFSPKGYQLATSADDHTIRIWDLRRRKCAQNILGHNKLISEVHFEPQYGRVLLTASYDCSIRLWSALEWRCSKALVGHEARVMSADIANPSSTSSGIMVGSVAYDRTLKLWSTSGKKAAGTAAAEDAN